MAGIQTQLTVEIEKDIKAFSFVAFTKVTVDRSYIFDRAVEDLSKTIPIISVWNYGNTTVAIVGRNQMVREYGIQVRFEKRLDLENEGIKVSDMSLMVDFGEELQKIFEPDEDNDNLPDAFEVTLNDKLIQWQRTEIQQIDDTRMDENVFQQDFVFYFREQQ